MDLSLFLAKTLGIYMLIVGAGVILNRAYFQTMLQDFAASPAFVLLAGVVTLILGTLMIVAHNLWVADWRVVITLLGWTIFLKGVAYLVAPQSMGALAKHMERPCLYYISAAINMLIGLFLFYQVGWLRLMGF